MRSEQQTITTTTTIINMTDMTITPKKTVSQTMKNVVSTNELLYAYNRMYVWFISDYTITLSYHMKCFTFVIYFVFVITHNYGGYWKMVIIQVVLVPFVDIIKPKCFQSLLGHTHTHNIIHTWLA